MSTLIFIPILVHFYAVLMKAVMLNERIFLFVNLKSIFLKARSLLIQIIGARINSWVRWKFSQSCMPTQYSLLSLFTTAVLMKAAMLNDYIFISINLKNIFKQEVHNLFF